MLPHRPFAIGYLTDGVFIQFFRLHAGTSTTPMKLIETPTTTLGRKYLFVVVVCIQNVLLCVCAYVFFLFFFFFVYKLVFTFIHLLGAGDLWLVAALTAEPAELELWSLILESQ